MCASLGAIKHQGAVKAKARLVLAEGRSVVRCNAAAAHPRGVCEGAVSAASGQAHLERTCWDPKDGDLCPARTKPGETLVEVRSDSDVQIDRLSRV
jgi:hypothetical protein